MISVLFVNKSKNELDALERKSRDIAAKLSDDKWDYYIFSDPGKFAEFISGDPVINIACMDVSMENGIENTEDVRHRCPDGYIILVADSSMSPVRYIKPSIVAQSLLLRPFTKEQLDENLKAAFKAYLKKLEAPDEKKCFVIDTRDGRQLVPFDNIFYFEAREKKIYANLGKTEYAFYGTLDKISELLPEYFLRFHRGFIVNRKKVASVNFPQNFALLSSGMIVPVSRSYKPFLKEALVDL
ncbi:MAG: LytR/AlgR family response regulator transcription factor [Porcipelethomonas sp.]